MFTAQASLLAAVRYGVRQLVPGPRVGPVLQQGSSSQGTPVVVQTHKGVGVLLSGQAAACTAIGRLSSVGVQMSVWGWCVCVCVGGGGCVGGGTQD
jgi:hypothetical protein